MRHNKIQKMNMSLGTSTCPQVQQTARVLWSSPEEYGRNWYLIITKRNKVQTLCIFIEMYLKCCQYGDLGPLSISESRFLLYNLTKLRTHNCAIWPILCPCTLNPNLLTSNPQSGMRKCSDCFEILQPAWHQCCPDTCEISKGSEN